VPASVDWAPKERHSSVVRGFIALVALSLGLVSGCAPRPEQLAPNEALSAFLTALDRSTHAPEQLETAFAWIDKKSQAALKQRASLAASLAGRSIAPWDMLVPGRASFSAYSVPSLRMRAAVEGDKARITMPVEGRDDLVVDMVREDRRWRVLLGITPGQ
jgi:hypothetical protein